MATNTSQKWGLNSGVPLTAGLIVLAALAGLIALNKAFASVTIRVGS